MCYSKLTMFTPYVLLFSACTIVMPTYRDNGPHTGPHVQGGSDSTVQQFYDYRIQHRGNNTIVLHPYLSDKLTTLLSNAGRGNSHRESLSSDPLSSRTTLPDNVYVASASTTPNRDVRNISLHADLKQGDQGWQDEVLMIQEGQCWVTDDVHHLGDSVHAIADMFRQSIENR